MYVLRKNPMYFLSECYIEIKNAMCLSFTPIYREKSQSFREIKMLLGNNIMNFTLILSYFAARECFLLKVTNSLKRTYTLMFVF